MTISYVNWIIISKWNMNTGDSCETTIVKIPNDLNYEEIFLDIQEQIYGQETNTLSDSATKSDLKRDKNKTPDKTKVFLKRYNPKLWKKKKKDEIFRTAWGKSYFKTPQEVKDIRKGLNKLRKIK